MIRIAAVVFAALVAVAPPQSNVADMESAMAKAQANARHPGDEAMSCDALQDELVATMQDPAVAAVMTRNGAYARQQQDKLDAAHSAQSTASKASTAARIVAGFVSGFVPGAGAAGMAAQAAQARTQMAEAAKNQADMMQRMQDMLTIMPQMMRGQRLVELAQERQCGWMTAAGGE
ncbi:MAG TPA: hypothetical protein VFB07_06670 [Vicinamibacterales bacterium]|nr:hypothetical protein [Vicinamibacterales bacterium]